MIVLSVCNHKGGTGKTTSALHFAAALGLSGHRVLIIDLDPQSFLTRTLGVDEPPEAASSLMLFQHERPLSDVAVERRKGFDLLPSSSLLTKVMRRLNKPTDVLWAKETLEQVGGYDLVLIDTAAAVTVFSLNALVASRYVLIPVTPEYQPIIGAEQTAQSVAMVRSKLNPDLAEPLFLLTQVDARKRDHYKYRRYVRKRYSSQVFDTIIRTCASLATTYADGSTVFEHDPYSRGARDYANATDELLRRLAPSLHPASEAAVPPEGPAFVPPQTEPVQP